MVIIKALGQSVLKLQTDLRGLCHLLETHVEQDDLLWPVIINTKDMGVRSKPTKNLLAGYRANLNTQTSIGANVEEKPPSSCHPSPAIYKYFSSQHSALGHSHADVYSYLEIKKKIITFYQCIQTTLGLLFHCLGKTWGQKFRNHLSDSYFMG